MTTCSPAERPTSVSLSGLQLQDLFCPSDIWMTDCSVPVDKGFDHGDADHKEHEHGEGHHGEAQQDGSVLPNTRHRHLGPNSLLSVSIHSSTPLLLLHCRAVILPTIWRYLQLLEAPPYFLGLGLSAFSLSGLLTGPLFGFWSDRWKNTKSIILFSNLFEIAGNFMYFIGYSKWLLLCSRLVAGVGAGAGSSIFGFLTQSTRPEERAGIFAAIMACRQAGLLVGPAFNLFLRLCDFKLGPFVVNKYTSPGIFMCLLWVLLQCVVLAMYWDLPPIKFLREEVVVLLTAQFITLFNQTALETMVTPLTQRSFGFGELGNSLMYSLCGVEVILGFFFVRWLSSKVADRVVLAVGLVICCTACIWSLVFLCDPRGGYGWELTAFIIGVFLQLLGLPFVAVSQVSLFSKVTDEKTQGFSQGIRRSVGGLATILGPLWAGGLTNNLYIMLGMMLALLMMITVMAALSYERLTEPRAVQCAQSSDSGG
nr:PREDICTED: major facilitator superfamily domain-containing protein 8-like [Paralichthys olivaceus]